MAEQTNETMNMFIKINKFSYLCGLPNIWINEVQLPKHITYLVLMFRKGLNAVIAIFMLLEWAAFFTQNNLTEKQVADRLMFSFSHPMLYVFIINVERYSQEFKELLSELAINLKQIYNDKDTEKEMIWKCKMYSNLFTGFFMMALLFYGMDASLQAVSGGTIFIYLHFSLKIIEAR
jgi:hypothetical protein